MKVAFLAHGTRGDIQPALAIGAVLDRRGHSVNLCVNADLADWATRSGLKVTASDLDVGRFLQSDEAREILAKGRISTLVRRVTADERRADESIAKAVVETTTDADVIVSTLGMALRGAAVHETIGTPAMNLYCAPLTPTGQWASLASPVRDLRAGWANRLSFKVFHDLLWRQSRPSVDHLCDQLGAERLSSRPALEAIPSLHVVSPQLVPRPDDWGSGQHLVGPALPDADLRARLGETIVPAGLEDWLDSGSPPVYFGFGSMPVLNPRALVDDLIAVTQELGVRGLIGAGWTRYGVRREELPETLYLVDEHLDHQQVLPRCAAAVHHGGSGTTAAVTRAGIPSVVVSVFLDQPFWGWRLTQTGLGTTFPYRSLTRGRLTRALAEVLAEGYLTRARTFAAIVEPEDGATRAADLIEHQALA
ncbi:sterol 3beta-glucosyltransferase [Kribbella steppae]|uniref:Sterol 3beta-glucosyltransferase n=1 Tax=Kribbella steppae TaxID=2512223 RepID=A0A4R2HGJ4_9ACTN|nr:glycosyltransferase [Kribbella steppae]TCO28232.1 sterol 3beta-glucosyltransferase [Kribbella steppae]